MENQNVSENILSDPKNTTTVIFNLVVGRVLKRVYLDLDKQGKEKMEKTFLSDDENKKEEFVKKYIPNFKDIFKEEAKKIQEEFRIEIEKQV